MFCGAYDGFGLAGQHGGRETNNSDVVIMLISSVKSLYTDEYSVS